ncbi:hypothetical protein Q9233_004917 [Columba guinea]|nr:hypothetical protein Q9233_004917 [Columba guinea]
MSDEVAPYFKTEPGLPQIHLEGNRLVLTCLAEGSWPLEFKWLHNDSEITAYSSEYKYVIPALRRWDAGSYQCVVRNRMGALLQRRSEVQVAYMGNFLDTDQRKTVTEGQAAVLNFLHILSYPRPQVTWFRDGHKIIPSSRMSTLLTVFNLNLKNLVHGRECETDLPLINAAEEGRGWQTACGLSLILSFNIFILIDSDKITARMLITGKNKLKEKDALEGDLIYIHNSNCLLLLCVYCIRFDGVGMDVGERVVLIASVSEKRELKFFAFYVTSGSFCEVEVAVVLPQDWQDLLHLIFGQATCHKQSLSFLRAITLENQLVILATSATDAGSYYVQAVNEKNGENKTSPFIHLSVASATDPSGPAAPVIVVPPHNTSVVAGSSETTLECVASARPLEKLSVTWKRNGVKITSGISSFGRRLTIANPTSADVGMYFCEANLRDSTEEPARAKAFLSIMEPPYFTAEPERVILAEVEKDVDILCQAMGVPIPTLVWYKDSVPLSKLENPRYKVLLSGGLRIQALRPQDAGIFQCFASNKAGEIQTYSYLDVTNIKPAFVQAPEDTTVTEGMTAVLTCEVSGAPKPAISWKKGNQILASGSVQIPRFILLESGGLQITPVFLQDAGNYTCCAVNSEGALNAFVMLTVWNRTFIVHPPEDSTVIKGTTATLRCGATHDPRISIRYVWKKDSVVINPSSSSRITVESDGTLIISQTWSGDIGDYTCEVISFGGNDSRMARLEVIELPHSPQNLVATLNSSYSRSVTLSWVRPFDGNSPVLYYMVELSENNSPWKVHLSNLDPKMTSVTVSGLTPARTYQFRVCAVNQVGKGQYSSETSRLMLPEEPPSAPPKNIVASGRTNQSIMVQWQPPPESEHNGVLHGYILRYRLAGLPGEYQYKNITSAEINYCLVKDLIIWTQYEIQVASYNGAGLGAFSRPVTEYTLQGVPTAPPQNVQVEAVNSTTIQFFWNPPPQQFINGINQGYKLLAWPADAPETVTVVTIAPDFHGVHSGCITSLKKYTAYYTSVLCFTTPGDGPRSTPQLLRTLEDKPGAVGHLSFTEILDTSLKVSWQEPVEKNGIITGKYQLLSPFFLSMHGV